MRFLLLLWLADPGAFETAYRTGVDALNTNRLPTAQVELEKAAALRPKDPRVWLALAQTYWRQKKTVTAQAAAARVEPLAAGNPTILHGLALYYVDAKDYSHAADAEAVYAQKTPSDGE